MRGNTWQPGSSFLHSFLRKRSANRLGLCFGWQDTWGGGHESVGSCRKQGWATALLSRDSLPVGAHGTSPSTSYHLVSHPLLMLSPSPKLSQPQSHESHTSGISAGQGLFFPSPGLMPLPLPRIQATASSPLFPLPHPSFPPPSYLLSLINFTLLNFWIVNISGYKNHYKKTWVKIHPLPYLSGIQLPTVLSFPQIFFFF